jgi:hypothetical protein
MSDNPAGLALRFYLQRMVRFVVCEYNLLRKCFGNVEQGAQKQPLFYQRTAVEDSRHMPRVHRDGEVIAAPLRESQIDSQ